MNWIDLAGKRFGALVALRFIPAAEAERGKPAWLCRCDCGREREINAYLLRHGQTRSCGCLQTKSRWADASGRRVGRLTAIEPVPDTYYGGEPLWRWKCDCGRIIRKPLSQVNSTASTMCPACRRELNRAQAESMREKQNRDPETGLSPGMLRGMMQGKTASNNTSGVRGVTWHSRVGKWQARVFSHGKCVWAGYFADIEQAKRARQEKLNELFPLKNNHAD